VLPESATSRDSVISRLSPEVKDDTRLVYSPQSASKDEKTQAVLGDNGDKPNGMFVVRDWVNSLLHTLLFWNPKCCETLQEYKFYSTKWHILSSYMHEEYDYMYQCLCICVTVRVQSLCVHVHAHHSSFSISALYPLVWLLFLNLWLSWWIIFFQCSPRWFACTWILCGDCGGG
jgi:hypothetical protein